MELHENIILDLLPAVRDGAASAESRDLVDRYLAAHPDLARLAAQLPGPDPALELKCLRQTRQRVRQAALEQAFAIFFTLLPFAFVFDGGQMRFVFGAYPGAIVGMAVTAAAFWARVAMLRRRSTPA
jgi:hypothetical protein